MTPERIAQLGMDLIKQDNASELHVQLHSDGSCFITDSEGYPYSGVRRAEWGMEQAEALAQVLQAQGFKVKVVECAKIESVTSSYRRLVGLSASLIERASAGVSGGLKVLSDAFSTVVSLEDIPFIRYRVFEGTVELEDTVKRLGGILTSVDANEMDPTKLVAFLRKHGAKSSG